MEIKRQKEKESKTNKEQKNGQKQLFDWDWFSFHYLLEKVRKKERTTE